MYRVAVVLIIALAGCSAPTGSGETLASPADAGAEDVSEDDGTSGECPCPDSLTCVQGFCVRSEPSDAGSQTNDPTDTATDSVSDTADGQEGTADTTDSGAAAGDAADAQSDTGSDADTGIDCQPDTKCCENGTPQNDGEACDDGSLLTDRTRCQAGACRECECKDGDGICCDGCFYRPKGKVCDLRTRDLNCVGGQGRGDCGGQLERTKAVIACTGQSAHCSWDTGKRRTEVAVNCSSDRTCRESKDNESTQHTHCPVSALCD